MGPILRAFVVWGHWRRGGANDPVDPFHRWTFYVEDSIAVGSSDRCIPDYMGKAMTQHNDVRCESMRKGRPFSRCTYAVKLKLRLYYQWKYRLVSNWFLISSTDFSSRTLYRMLYESAMQ